MNKILVFDWAHEVNPEKWGYKHNEMVVAELHALIDFFLDKGVKVMISPANKDDLHDYLLCLDTRMFTQR